MPTATPDQLPAPARRGRLTARPRVEPVERHTPITPGIYHYGRGPRDGVFVVPLGHDPTTPGPLVVFLHGAGGDRRQGLLTAQEDVGAAGGILIIPESEGRSWDLIEGELGPDVAKIDRALASAFDAFHIDPTRVVISGFSDGASYAATLGLVNGDVFSHVLAFSPGFATSPEVNGAAKFFVSHGIHDPVLPISRTSRVLVPRLERAGLKVRYVEFDGGHAVPPELVDQAMRFVDETAGR